jgi:hypothetical protein
MKKKISFLGLTFTLILFINVSAKAQNYTTSAGLRFGGYENGLTVKHFIGSETAIEGILGFRSGGFVLTGLYEIHAPAFNEPSLTWFYGYGAHIGGTDGGYRRYSGNNNGYGRGLLLGADAIIGLEWQMPDLPLTLGVDLHPRLELAKGPFLDLEPALTIRYTF